MRPNPRLLAPSLRLEALQRGSGMADHKAAKYWATTLRYKAPDTEDRNLYVAYLELRELANELHEAWVRHSNTTAIVLALRPKMETLRILLEAK